MAPPYVFAYVTASSREEAYKIGRALLEKKLAACVNLFDGMQSLYWWEGKIEESKEAVLLVKTDEKRIESVMRVVKGLHSYSCPCVVSFRIEGGNPEYLKWLGESLG